MTASDEKTVRRPIDELLDGGIPGEILQAQALRDLQVAAEIVVEEFGPFDDYPELVAKCREIRDMKLTVEIPDAG